MEHEQQQELLRQQQLLHPQEEPLLHEPHEVHEVHEQHEEEAHDEPLLAEVDVVAEVVPVVGNVPVEQPVQAQRRATNKEVKRAAEAEQQEFLRTVRATPGTLDPETMHFDRRAYRGDLDYLNLAPILSQYNAAMVRKARAEAAQNADELQSATAEAQGYRHALLTLSSNYLKKVAFETETKHYGRVEAVEGLITRLMMDDQKLQIAQEFLNDQIRTTDQVEFPEMVGFFNGVMENRDGTHSAALQAITMNTFHMNGKTQQRRDRVTIFQGPNTTDNLLDDQGQQTIRLSFPMSRNADPNSPVACGTMLHEYTHVSNALVYNNTMMTIGAPTSMSPAELRALAIERREKLQQISDFLDASGFPLKSFVSLKNRLQYGGMTPPLGGADYITRCIAKRQRVVDENPNPAAVQAAQADILRLEAIRAERQQHDFLVATLIEYDTVLPQLLIYFESVYTQAQLKGNHSLRKMYSMVKSLALETTLQRMRYDETH